MDWNMADIYARLRAIESGLRTTSPVPPSRPRAWTTWRRRIAQAFVGLGLRLDADASRRVLGPLDSGPRFESSDV